MNILASSGVDMPIDKLLKLLIRIMEVAEVSNNQPFTSAEVYRATPYEDAINAFGSNCMNGGKEEAIRRVDAIDHQAHAITTTNLEKG
ncbi:hypothetical protein GWI33_005525 [Rhynchophorus ferrugineus]|uniref:Uncharacterized protein n=1 Tax=Rhynchophorus ferrugineus TaxID=354439 RepID=A0A834ILI4_RHYFE|nr:hypothetical protein GWI33_005525 [Rhynchophorus ferrugineus]